MASSGMRPALAGMAISAFLIFASSAAAREPVRLPPPVRSALAAAGIPAASAALYVQEVGARTPALAHNAAVPMNPASTIKLVTTYAALELLGPAFTWKTEVYLGPIRGDVLEGDLILRGTGDPKLKLENFWLLLRALRERGLREIRGDLVLDRGYFEPAEHDPGKFDNEPVRPTTSGPTPCWSTSSRSVSISCRTRSASRSGSFPSRARRSSKSHASIALSDGPCNDWRADLRREFESNEASARASFGGTLSRRLRRERSGTSRCSRTRPMTAACSASSGRSWAGSFRGGVRDGTVPAGARRLLHRHESQPLAEVVRDINKFSNNVMARQLFLTLAAERRARRRGRQARAESCASGSAARDSPRRELVLENGSGLSRNERISAEHARRRCCIAAWHSAVMPEFVSSLPVVVADGTMKQRLRNARRRRPGAYQDRLCSPACARIAGYVLDRARTALRGGDVHQSSERRRGRGGAGRAAALGLRERHWSAARGPARSRPPGA